MMGVIVFVVVYVVATFLYPGGSQVNKNSIGFSWTNNYWCNLLNENAINGQHNPARPIAITGMFILCSTLAFFWILFSKHANTGKINRLVIQISAILSMTIAFFLFTSIDHDLLTNLASFFGIIATTGTFIGLYKNKWYGLFFFGLLNMLLVGLNNYLYYNKGLIIYLPIVQKVSFGTFLVWVCSIDLRLYRQAIVTARD